MTRKKLYAIIITAILVAAIIAGIYYWMSTGGPSKEDEVPPVEFTMANVTGTVTDEDTGDLIEGAEVKLYEIVSTFRMLKESTTTGSDGVYLFSDVQYTISTNYSITVETAEHLPKTKTVYVDAVGKYTVDFVLKLSGTFVYLEPSEIILNTVDVSVGYRFTVTAMVSDVTDLFGFQVSLYYDASVINVTSASLPADHVFAGEPGMPVSPRYDYFDSWGVGLTGFTCLAGATPFNGSGKLAEFEIEIIAAPPEGGSLTSDLIISPENSPTYPGTDPPRVVYETSLFNSAGLPIGFTATDGHYEYVG